MNGKKYTLSKMYWTTKDYESMGWHDSKIHGISFNSHSVKGQYDILFDIDYIFKWIDPVPPDKNYTFWVSPCTLIFHQVEKFKLDLDSEDYLSTEIEIVNLSLTKKNEIDHFQADIETNFGDIEFITSGYEQFVRNQPKHKESQWLDLDERGGISFESEKLKIKTPYNNGEHP